MFGWKNALSGAMFVIFVQKFLYTWNSSLQCSLFTVYVHTVKLFLQEWIVTQKHLSHCLRKCTFWMWVLVVHIKKHFVSLSIQNAPSEDSDQTA